MLSGIGLFGGSFNPIHVGHVVAARTVAEYLDLGRVILIPAGCPPHRWPGELADAEDRLEMVRLAVEPEPLLEAGGIELQQTGMTHAIRSVESYRARLGPDVRLHWIIGADLLPHLAGWHRIAELADLCQIVTAIRAGFDPPALEPLSHVLRPDQIARLRSGFIPTPRMDVSSTEIRWRVREGRSIRCLVPDAVAAYIACRRLYQEVPDAGGPPAAV